MNEDSNVYQLARVSYVVIDYAEQFAERHTAVPSHSSCDITQLSRRDVSSQPGVFSVFISVVNKDFTLKVNAKAKDLTSMIRCRTDLVIILDLYLQNDTENSNLLKFKL